MVLVHVTTASSSECVKINLSSPLKRSCSRHDHAKCPILSRLLTPNSFSGVFGDCLSAIAWPSLTSENRDGYELERTGCLDKFR